MNKATLLFTTLWLLIVACSGPAIKENPYLTSWSHYLGDPGRTHYSQLDQINLSNVNNLEVAWEYQSGGSNETNYIQLNPLMANGLLYGMSPNARIFALDAATGKEIWAVKPKDQPNFCRGFLYWEEGEDKRLIVGLGRHFAAMNALTGEMVASFGENGLLDLKQNLGQDVEDVNLMIRTPGVIYGDLIIQGFSTSETVPAAPGHIRAFDVRTGEQKMDFPYRSSARRIRI